MSNLCNYSSALCHYNNFGLWRRQFFSDYTCSRNRSTKRQKIPLPWPRLRSKLVVTTLLLSLAPEDKIRVRKLDYIDFYFLRLRVVLLVKGLKNLSKSNFPKLIETTCSRKRVRVEKYLVKAKIVTYAMAGNFGAQSLETTCSR